jgi:ERCC4-type nuclease
VDVILVDSRAGSEELVKPLLNLGLPVEETQLDYGDVAFLGRGEGGKQVFIGVEHKKVPDLVQSLTSGRLQGHQLPGMLQMYDRSWLVVEGEWTTDPAGSVHTWQSRGKKRRLKGAPPAMELEKRLLCLETRGGFRVRHCPGRQDTLRFLFALYRYWTDKDLDEHKSHLAIHAPDMDAKMLDHISDFRRIAAQVPGIGMVRSEAFELAYHGSMLELCNSTVEAIAEVRTSDDKGKTRRVGESTARKIWEALK